MTGNADRATPRPDRRSLSYALLRAALDARLLSDLGRPAQATEAAHRAQAAAAALAAHLDRQAHP